MTKSQDKLFQTPMMKQYLQFKQDYPDCILFFRLGDFYEMFLDDAKVGAEVLDITLTARNRGKDGKIPMAGVPHHAVESYLFKLIKEGYKVAICEQVSDPDGKGLVDREVVRVVTPGTQLDSKNLTHKRNNFTFCMDLSSKSLAIAACDLGTGEFYSSEYQLSTLDDFQGILANLITKFSPAECLIRSSMDVGANSELIPKLESFLSKFEDLFVYSYAEWSKVSKKANSFLKRKLDVKSLKLVGIDPSSKQSIQVAAVLWSYIEYTQKQKLTHIKKIKPFADNRFLQMDRSTINNLELLTSLWGNKKNSLIKLIDFTNTAMGGRLLKTWLLQPSLDKFEINTRLNWVEKFAKDHALRENLASNLSQITDLERLVSRLSLGFGNPRDLINLKHSLQKVVQISQLAELIFLEIPTSVSKIIENIEQTIIEEAPISPKNGGFIKEKNDSTLDDLRSRTNNSKDWMSNFEKDQRQKTGISSLKVKFNKVFGFYIEVSKTNLDLVPADYDRKQTLVNAERFITPQLKEHEEIILHAQEKIDDIEYQLFLQIVEKTLKYTHPLQQLAKQVAYLDCLVSFAQVAIEFNFTRPQLIDQGEIKITQGRHPVVENLIEKYNFIPNDLKLGSKGQQLIIITGPNMAGKSVLMRQTAIIVLLAHMGSFVPAREAQIAITDRIFVRSGASDMISEGLSTFMVEMVETAQILREATNRSLVIMDEIGRGTSTYDGISIAWAVASSLVKDDKNQPKTLFATHYHELQDLENHFPDQISNFHMAIKNHQGEPIFLYTLKKGSASHSFGIEVAKLAGIPKSVITHAQKLLSQMEKENGKEIKVNNFVEPEIQTSSKEESEIEKVLADINPQTITPLEALNLLSELKSKLN